MTHVYALAVAMLLLHSQQESAIYSFDTYEEAAEACFEYSIGEMDPFLCAAIGYTESRWSPWATGKKLPSGLRAKGMMQVIPEYAVYYVPNGSKLDPWNAADSVVLASAVLNRYADVYGKSKALCHYAGGDRVCAARYARMVVRLSDELTRLAHEVKELEECLAVEDLIASIGRTM